MRLSITVLMLLSGSLCSIASAQNAALAGEPLSFVPARTIQFEAPSAEPSGDKTARRIWTASLFALAAATSADAATSWGKHETNQLLSSPNGTFGARGVSIKFGIAAATIFPQVLLRRNRNLRMKFAIANLATAGMYGALAVHNAGVATPNR